MTRATPQTALIVNDIHSRLNATVLEAWQPVRTSADIETALARARRDGLAVAIAGGRHAMGGQQFASGGLLLDMRGFDRVLDFDAERGLVTTQAGIEWPALLGWLETAQPGAARPWTIAQKQTGADRFSLGGSLSANIHGRGLTMAPLIGDVEAFTLICADGTRRHCSRCDNAELFGLAIGGYGLFGVIETVTLRLQRRQRLRRVVELIRTDALMAAFDARIAAGFTYGDFQFAIDPAGDDFLSLGVFSCYEPVDAAERSPSGQHLTLAPEHWAALIALAHVDKAEAFRRYAEFYLASSGQLYDSDTHQLSFYDDDYHQAIDARLGHVGSEVITELYVPRARLADFMRAAAADLRRHRHDPVDVIYGTVRLIRRDAESFLPWAPEDSACVIFNLHVAHTAAGQAAAAAAFRRLIDLAAALSGSFYLTYHRHATVQQLRACHPRFEQFLAKKREHDPGELFQSDWYRHYRALFGPAGATA